MPETIPVEGMAFLDAVAVGEDDVVSDYNELVGGDYFESYASFPKWDGVRIGGVMTHAAGRYQFEPATWQRVAAACGLTNFEPASQDIGAWWLARADYHAHIGRDLLADLQAGAIVHIGSTLRPTWSSLSDATFPARYQKALAVLRV